MGRASDKPTILITGGEGQLGFELARAFAAVGEVFALTRTDLDLADPDAIVARCREIKPDLILNPGAYTAVDKAESEPELAMRINGVAPGILAEEAKRLGAPLIHYSTDYVFDGRATVPYAETAATAPRSVYGESKLAGEQAVAAATDSHLILRTSWLYGNRRQNFFLTMLRLAKERDVLRVVADQVGAPTWVRPVAESTATLLTGRGGNIGLGIGNGLYHLSAGGRTSWHGFASAIVDGLPARERRAREVIAITTADYPTPAKRPAFSVLCGAKLAEAIGVVQDDWQLQLAHCFAERTAQERQSA